MELLQKSPDAVCLKRKLVGSYLTKDSKSRVAEVGNASFLVESGLSSDPHAHRCFNQSNLANDCFNYLNSTVPSRVMFYKEGSWCNFPEEVVPSLVDAFKGDKSSVVVVMDDQPLLVDFLSMTLVNLKTRKQRSVAWLDSSGKWFFPTAVFDEEVDESTKLASSIVEGSTRGINGDRAVKCPSEVVKQVLVETCLPVPQNFCTADILHKKIVPVERGSESFVCVQNLFLSGMGSFATPTSILHIHRYSPKHITAQCRLEAFERQIRLTRDKCGAANVRYGWLGSRKQDIVRILVDGFVRIGKTTGNAYLDAGIYLSPENRAFTSVGVCDVDENGVQYMLLCRAVLGNMGATNPGSQEDYPSTKYLVSFRLAPKVQEYLGQKGLWFHPPKQDHSTLQPLICKSSAGPTSPWVSLKVLFESIQGSISPIARELLFLHYEELKDNKITREEMVKKMMIIVGEKMLLDTLTKINCSPSLWYKSPAKVTTDTTNTATNSICMNAISRNVSSATLGPDSLAPGAVPVKCKGIDPKIGGSALVSVALEHQDFPSPSMPLHNSSAHCHESCDASPPIMVPTIHTSVPRGVPENFSLTMNNCNVGPSMKSNDHAPFIQTSASERHNSVLSTSTVENSESLSMKYLHSVGPSTVPQISKPLPTGIEPETFSYPDSKVSEVAISGVSPQFHSASMPHQSCARSTASHLRVRSMVSQLRVPSTSKVPQVQVQGTMLQTFEKIVKLQAQYSGAKDTIPTSSTPLLPTGTPKGVATPKLSEKLKFHQSQGLNMRTRSIDSVGLRVALKDSDNTAISTTEGQKGSTLTNMVPSYSAAQGGTNKKVAMQGVDAGVTVTVAADALVALSEQGRLKKFR